MTTPDTPPSFGPAEMLIGEAFHRLAHANNEAARVGRDEVTVELMPLNIILTRLVDLEMRAPGGLAKVYGLKGRVPGVRSDDPNLKAALAQWDKGEGYYGPVAPQSQDLGITNTRNVIERLIDEGGIKPEYTDHRQALQIGGWYRQRTPSPALRERYKADPVFLLVSTLPGVRNMVDQDVKSGVQDLVSVGLMLYILRMHADKLPWRGDLYLAGTFPGATEPKALTDGADLVIVNELELEPIPDWPPVSVPNVEALFHE